MIRIFNFYVFRLCTVMRGYAVLFQVYPCRSKSIHVCPSLSEDTLLPATLFLTICRSSYHRLAG